MFRRVMGGGSFLPGVRDRVEQHLRDFLAEKREEAATLSPDSVELVDAVEALTMRGGKRLRPLVAAAAFRAVDPTADLSRVADVGASLELLQTFLLIHDDWMDHDEERRGGPSVWAWLRDRHGDAHLGAALGVLAGDLAAGYASELLARAPFPAARRGEATAAFHRMQTEVFLGQHLDLVATRHVERMYDLKTGSYTTRGPLRLGAILADARAAQTDALERFATPLGIAFQLRDELLGTFGDPTVTGKPAGNDLRAGKRTVLVEEIRARGSASQVESVERVLGRTDAPDDEIAHATAALSASGARDRVEALLATLIARAEDALAQAPLDVAPLRAVMRLLAFRDR